MEKKVFYSPVCLLARTERTLLRACAALFAMVTAGPALAANSTIEGYYTGEVLYNADGGLTTGSAYLDDAGVVITSEFDSIFGNFDAIFFGYVLYNNSSSFSADYVGDIQGVSNIDAIEALRIYELWYEQGLSESTSLRIGLYDLNTEFDAIDTGGLFINSSHGIGAEFAQSGENGPSIFPVTSLAVRFDWQINNASTLRYAIMDAVPGDPDHPSHTTIQLDSEQGVLHALEYNYGFSSGARLGVGGWLYSAEFDVIASYDPGEEPRRKNGNSGVYAFIDAPVFTSTDSTMSIDAFIRYGVANDELNVLDSYLGAGIVATGLMKRRPDDLLGLAIARATVGDPARQAFAAEGQMTDNFELNIELTYSAQLTDWLRVQPNIQYIVNPGADRSLADALVFGLRFELSTSSDVISHEWP